MRLWMLMASIAVVAGLIAYGQYSQRLAKDYEEKARWFAFHNWSRVAMPPLMRASDDDRAKMRSQDARRRQYWARMEAKYRWAARYPWIPVLPDPPEPK
jgi:hypothetical protein